MCVYIHVPVKVRVDRLLQQKLVLTDSRYKICRDQSWGLHKNSTRSFCLVLSRIYSLKYTWNVCSFSMEKHSWSITGTSVVILNQEVYFSPFSLNHTAVDLFSMITGKQEGVCLFDLALRWRFNPKLWVCSETGKGGSSITNEYWNNEVWCSSSGYGTLGKSLSVSSGKYSWN